MLKVSFATLVASDASLLVLQKETGVTFETRVKIKKTLRKIQEAAADLFAAKAELDQQSMLLVDGKPVPDGTGFKAKDPAAYAAAMKEVSATIVEIDVEKLTYGEIKGSALSALDLELLDWLLEE